MRFLLSLPVLCLGALLLGTAPSPGWAMGLKPLTEEEKKTKFEGIRGLTHHRSRIHGIWANGQEYYQYKGTTDACQEFVNHLASLKGIAVKEIRLEKGGLEPKIDWKLCSSHTNLIGKKDGKEGTVLRVTIILNGKVNPRKLKIPKGITVIGKGADA